MIPARDWNAFLARRRRHRLTGVIVNEVRVRGHAWKLYPQWTGEAWAVRIRPGFVNGLCATVDMEDGETKLTDRPLWPLGAFRAIGPAAQPVSSSFTATGEIKFSFEPVPPFFKWLGVGDPPTVNGTTLEKVDTGADPAKQRLLVACDIVLYQDHPATVGKVDVQSGDTGNVITVNAEFLDATRLKKRPYLRQTSLYTPPAVPVDPYTAATLGWEDVPRSQRHLGTVWLVSPPGADPDAGPDGSWTAYPQHHLFFNLDHGTNAIAQPLDETPLSLNTGLAAGVGDVQNRLLLAQVNDANSSISKFFSAARFTGAWNSI
jgi:hypothetical protein